MTPQEVICRTIFVFKHRWVLYNILINTAGHAVREKRADRAGKRFLPFAENEEELWSTCFFITVPGLWA